MAEDVFGGDYYIWSCRDVHDYLVFLFREKRSEDSAGEGLERSWNERRQRLERAASELQNSVHSFLGGTLSAAIGGEGRFPGELRGLYHASLRTLRLRMEDSGEFLASADAFESPIQVGMSTDLHDSPTFVHLLEVGRWEAARSKLDETFALIARADPYSRQEYALELGFAFGSALVSISHRNGKLLESVIGDDFAALFEPHFFRSADRLRDWTNRVLDKVRDDIRSEQNETVAYLVRKAQEYVENHLSGDTSLQAVADHIPVHPVYLSRVYKAETGEGLSGYILRLKMEKAERLLSDSAMRIHEIAEQIGFNNPSYFIKVFKKYFGWTPKDYREHAGR
jgi:two-component system response regulator YesN